MQQSYDEMPSKHAQEMKSESPKAKERVDADAAACEPCETRPVAAGGC